MKLGKALVSLTDIAIFKIDEDHDPDSAPNLWEAEPINGQVLENVDEVGFFVVKAINIRPGQKNCTCYMDISLPERINDCTYFLSEDSVVMKYTHEVERNVVPAIVIDCFGIYEMFYSTLSPEVGISILRDEGRLGEAAEAFEISAQEGPSSEYIYLELTQIFESLGNKEKSAFWAKLLAEEK